MILPTGTIRSAVASDFDALCALDGLAQRSALRRDRIWAGIDSNEVSLVVTDGYVAGYALLSYRFFGHGFIELVIVHPERQGAGLGPMLIEYVESRCSDSKLFTTTNRSNLRMQRVLHKLGYERSGIIHNLDPGDPELVYFKGLRGREGISTAAGALASGGGD